MSEILDINTVSASNTNEGMAYVPAIGTDGGLKRLKANTLGRIYLAKTFNSSPQWIRVMQFNGSSAGMFSIYHSWLNVAPQPMLIAFCFPSSQLDEATNTYVRNIIGNNARFPKARIVYPATRSGAIKPCWLEIYKAMNDPGIRLETTFFQNAVPMLEAGEIPEDYTSKEIALSAVIGGGVE